jgi:hypothetical protein
VTSCHCQGIEREFNWREAARSLAHYRRRGPAKTTRVLLSALQQAGAPAGTLLDIGGGVGAIPHALLKAGVQSAVSVEASPAYLEAARQEAERQGLAGHITFRHGDFVALADSLPPADIVTLDRVICCYPDMPGLVGLSAERARRLYAVVYPRDLALVRLGLRLINLYLRLQRSPMRVFGHPTAEVEAILRQRGLRLRFRRLMGAWQVAVYERAAGG